MMTKFPLTSTSVSLSGQAGPLSTMIHRKLEPTSTFPPPPPPPPEAPPAAPESAAAALGRPGPEGMIRVMVSISLIETKFCSSFLKYCRGEIDEHNKAAKAKPGA